MAAPPAGGTGPFVTITITVTQGQTTIRAEERTTNLAGAIFGGVGGRRIYKRSMRRRVDRMAEAVDGIAEIIEAAAAR